MVVRRVGGEGRQKKTNLTNKTQDLDPKCNERAKIGECGATSIN